jgi:hypothetical protein
MSDTEKSSKGPIIVAIIGIFAGGSAPWWAKSISWAERAQP